MSNILVNAQTTSVDRIFLDLQNPRHETYTSEAEVIDYLCRDEYVYTLAKEHAAVAAAVLTISQPWIVTYNFTDEIMSLYSQRRQFWYDINYSLQTKRIGSELLIASKGLRLPEAIRTRQANRPQHRVA